MAGSYCTSLFAGYGADVIKIEPPCHGDMSRRVGPFLNDIPHPEASGLFLHLNGNKRGITLDITSNTGAILFKELIAHTDLIVETFKPGYLESFGIGYEHLSGINPSLTHTSITPFGQTGPYAHHKATDIGIFAVSGRMYPHGDSDREPLPYAPDIASYQIGSTGAVASMGAVLAAKLQKTGDYIDVSAMEALIGNVDNRLLFYAYTGCKTPRQRWPIGAAQGAFDLAVDYVSQRQVFGQAIASFQNTRYKLAELKTSIELNRALSEKYIQQFIEGELTSAEASMLKLAASEMQGDVVDQCLQMFGGYGYMKEYRISRAYVDARIQRIYGGTSEIMKELISRSIVDVR